MEMILFIGIPASGKSSFYKSNFFNNAMRISLDLFKTRNKESHFLDLALSLHQRVVIDNTNVSRQDRAMYISKAKESHYTVTGYYFESKLMTCLSRNEARPEKDKIARAGVVAKHKALELPGYDEGFNRLYYVSINENNVFEVNNWNNEI